MRMLWYAVLIARRLAMGASSLSSLAPLPCAHKGLKTPPLFDSSSVQLHSAKHGVCAQLSYMYCGCFGLWAADSLSDVLQVARTA